MPATWAMGSCVAMRVACDRELRRDAGLGEEPQARGMGHVDLDVGPR